ncbi:MAG: hypothetical protein ACUZ8H_09870 [Candidatus Anammoxibacter sp.]
MTTIEDINNQVDEFNGKFVSVMFKKSKTYVFSRDTVIPNTQTEYLGDHYEQYDKAWKVPGVYVFLNAQGLPIYCGEASRHLWGRVCDHFAKKTDPPLSSLKAKCSWDETPMAIVLFYIETGDRNDAGMGYALETCILNNFKIKFNKRKN